LVLMIYRATESFPDREKYCLSDQLRRAIVSFTSNIAEGFAKKSSKEKNRFYGTLQTSLIEVQNQLLIAKDIGYLSLDDFKKIAKQTVICHKMIIN